jgi:hypothetical protein
MRLHGFIDPRDVAIDDLPIRLRLPPPTPHLFPLPTVELRAAGVRAVTLPVATGAKGLGADNTMQLVFGRAGHEVDLRL